MNEFLLNHGATILMGLSLVLWLQLVIGVYIGILVSVKTTWTAKVWIFLLCLFAFPTLWASQSISKNLKD